MLRITSRGEWVGHCSGWARTHARESPRRLVLSRKTLVAPGCHHIMCHSHRPLLMASCATSDMNTPCCKRARVPAKSAMKPAWRTRASRTAYTSSTCVISTMATSARGSVWVLGCAASQTYTRKGARRMDDLGCTIGVGEAKHPHFRLVWSTHGPALRGFVECDGAQSAVPSRTARHARPRK